LVNNKLQKRKSEEKRKEHIGNSKSETLKTPPRDPTPTTLKKNKKGEKKTQMTYVDDCGRDGSREKSNRKKVER